MVSVKRISQQLFGVENLIEQKFEIALADKLGGHDLLLYTCWSNENVLVTLAKGVARNIGEYPLSSIGARRFPMAALGFKALVC